MKDIGRFSKKYRGDQCLNCETPLEEIDRFCYRCGQINTTKKISFLDFFKEFFSSIFSYDSRLSHTIASLLFNPGKISKEYVLGKRQKYANPFRFYLSISIIFFIFNGLFINFEEFKYVKKENTENAIDKLSAIYTSEIQKIQAEDTTINRITTEIDNYSTQYYSEEQLDTMSFLKSTFKRGELYFTHHTTTNQYSAEIALDNLCHNKTWFNTYLYKRTVKTGRIDDDPTELFLFLFNKLPLIIFFFLPLFAMAMWLLYIRRSYNYMEHLIFTFHTQTMFFILLGIAILISKIFQNEAYTGITLILFLAYLFMAMLKFYGQNIGKTIVKFILANILFFILAGVGSVITIIGSVFIF